jgi:hypothetical protein
VDGSLPAADDGEFAEQPEMIAAAASASEQARVKRRDSLFISFFLSIFSA